MRIIGGKYGGRALSAPKGLATRPTTDRTRESLFNIMSNHISLDDKRVIDLFAGSGALGLEAMSRGARFCLFLDIASAPRASIRENVEKLSLQGATKIYRRDATKLGPCDNTKPFDVAFADPPYGENLGEKSARALLDGGWLNDGALFILEERKGQIPEELQRFEKIDVRSYGDTQIALFEYTA